MSRTRTEHRPNGPNRNRETRPIQSDTDAEELPTTQDVKRRKTDRTGIG